MKLIDRIDCAATRGARLEAQRAHALLYPATEKFASPVRNLGFASVDDENRLSVTFSVHARAAEFTLTDDQVVLLWELLGPRVAKLARRRD